MASQSADADQQFYSRQYYVYGAGAMERLRSSRVLLIGLGCLGAEVAKNLVLSGVATLLLFDPSPVGPADQQGHHLWIAPDDRGPASAARSRAQACQPALQALNPRCSVQVFEPSSPSSPPPVAGRGLPAPSPFQLELEQLAELRPDCVVCTVPTLGRQRLLQLACYCRALELRFVHVDVVGLAGRLFCNFGEQFVSLDPLGEQREDVLLTAVQPAPGAPAELLVTLAAGGDSRASSVAVGDRLRFGDIAPPLSTADQHDWSLLNGATATVLCRATDASSIRVQLHDDPDNKTKRAAVFERATSSGYVGGGSLRFLPKPAAFHHRCLTELLDDPLAADAPIAHADQLIDEQRARQLHALFCSWDTALDDVTAASMIGALPSNCRPFAAYLTGRAQPQLLADVGGALVERFYGASGAQLPPLNAFFGGMAAQEAIKAVTQKYSPLTQFFYLDVLDLLDAAALSEPTPTSPLWFLGGAALARLQRARVFVVGAGAIGCELLKNLAMLRVGHVTVTDDDAIEQSNLNRQFLFRDGDIGKLKSEVACARARLISPGRDATQFTALRHRVQASTEHVFTDAFLQSHSVVLNALDNLAARLYVDERCVGNGVPMIDSGTLGTQGHVQVVLPGLTECYASQSDPDGAQQIPLCTLKSFPHNITHCIEWARDLCFEKQLLVKPAVWNRVFFDVRDAAALPAPRTPPAWQQIDADTLSILAKLASPQHEHLRDFDACVRLARAKFDKYFDHDPRKLLELFPVGHLTPDGEPFWSPPRRLPRPLTYSPDQPLHAAFVASFARLFAAVWGVAVPPHLDSPAAIAQLAVAAAVPSFSARQRLVSSTPSVVDLLHSSQRTALLRSSSSSLTDSASPLTPGRTKQRTEEAVAAELQKLKDYWHAETRLPHLNAIEFDKDEPSGVHVALVAAAANLRAAVYGIEPHDLLAVKRIAGRILPAIAATTSCVSGLVCFELIKYYRQSGLLSSSLSSSSLSFRNAWLNLAVPSVMLSEPAPPETHRLGPHTSFTLWDKWDIREPDSTLVQLLERLTALSGGMTVSGVFQGARIIYIDVLHADRLATKVVDLLDLDQLARPYVGLTVTFLGPAVDNDDDDGVADDVQGPLVRFFVETEK